MTLSRSQIVLCTLALAMGSGVAFGACTEQAGIDAAKQDDAIGRSSGWRGWAPRTWMAWCSQCGGTVTNGRCVGAKLDGGAGSGGGSASSTGNAAVDAAQRVMNAGNFNTPQNAAMTASAGLATGFAVAAIQGLMAPPSAQQLAQREAARQEQARLQQEAAERRRLEEEEKQRRLMASLRGYQGGAAELRPRVEGASAAPASNLALIRRDGQAAVPLTPFGSGSVTPDQAASAGENLALLRRGDRTPVSAPTALQQLANTGAQPASGLPFDNGATVLGALPPPPPTPQGRPVGPAFTLEDLGKPGPKPRSEVTAVLNDAMQANQGAATTVKQEIARLESVPNRDAAKIAEERAKLDRIEVEQKAIVEKQKKVEQSKDEMIDLSIGQAEVSAAPGKPE